MDVCLHSGFAYQLKGTVESEKIKQKLEEDKSLLLQEKVSALVLVLFHSPPGRGQMLLQLLNLEVSEGEFLFHLHHGGERMKDFLR